MIHQLTLSAAFLLATAIPFTAAQEKPSQDKPALAAPAPTADAKLIATQKASYPLTTCPISSKPLGDGAVDYVHEGRLVRFCCGGCPDEFKKDPAATLAKIDAAVIAAQKATYPLDTCPVSGEKLDADPAMVTFDYVYGTRLVRFCCKSCAKTFDKDPAPIMAKIDAALIEQQKKSYPLKTCIVMTEEQLDSPDVEPVDFLYGTRLVRTCCKKCVRNFEKDPAKYLARLDAAAKPK